MGIILVWAQKNLGHEVKKSLYNGTSGIVFDEKRKNLDFVLC